MKIKELAIVLQVTKEMRPELEYVLDELIAEGKIEISKRGKYRKRKRKIFTGTFIGHPRGFEMCIRDRHWNKRKEIL